MKDLMNDVRSFHRLAEHPSAEKPTLLSVDRTRLRLRLILEEFEELVDSLYAASHGRSQAFSLVRAYLDDLNTPIDSDNNVEQLADVGDALTDLMYFAVGTGLEMGLPLDQFWAEVQRANMDKFPGGVVTKRADGKVIKPEGWKPPNHEEIVRRSLAE